MNYPEIFFLLIFGHLLADYPLQGDFLSRAKNRLNPIPGVPWYQAMFAHCGMHAGIVYLITGAWWAAVIEFSAHLVIDDIKCSGGLSFNQDQALHFLTKVIIISLIYFMN